jgi:transposase-like protein
MLVGDSGWAADGGATGAGAGDPLPVVLDTLTGVHQVAEAAETDLLVLVAEAYRRGASWADIARRLGRTKQSVHQRYQAQIHARRTRDLLATDLAEALAHARQRCCRDPADRDAVESRAFLRDRGVAGPAAARLRLR